MEKHVPLMSSSSLRYAPEVVAAQGGKGPTGAIVGVSTYGPAPTHPTEPRACSTTASTRSRCSSP